MNVHDSARKPVTDELIEQLAREAEAGYDVPTLKGRGGRKPLGSSAARHPRRPSRMAEECLVGQPEESRLLLFQGTSPRAMALRKHRTEVIDFINRAGGSNVRVFGSVATGRDHEGSDIDLLIDLPPTTGLLMVAKLERLLSEVIGVPVDIVPEDELRPDFKDRVLGEAQAL